MRKQMTLDITNQQLEQIIERHHLDVHPKHELNKMSEGGLLILRPQEGEEIRARITKIREYMSYKKYDLEIINEDVLEELEVEIDENN